MKAFDLSIIIDTNLRLANFLFVFLDLPKNIYKTYRKPNDRFSSVNVGSCHNLHSV